MGFTIKLTIVADENMAGVLDYFGDLGEVRLVKGRQLQQSDLADADVLLVRSVTTVNEKLLHDTPVKFVGTATSGFDHIDRNYLRKRRISFAHAPGSNANSVVEYVLGAIAGVDKKLEDLFVGGSLGIIGHGNIGSLLAKRLAALGLTFKVYDPWLDAAEVPHASSLQEVLACNVISLHAELTEKTPWPSFHLLGEEELRQIAPTTLLINASRGAVINNTALRKCLEEGSGPSCILDVWEGEPLVSERLLSLCDFGSAHIAGYSLDGKLLASRILKDALMESLQISLPTVHGNDADDVPPISLTGPISGAPLLRALLHHNYQLAVDDRLLHDAVVGKPDAEVAANFDRLRKEYRVRREVFGSKVEMSAATGANLSLLEAMGCQLIENTTGEG